MRLTSKEGRVESSVTRVIERAGLLGITAKQIALQTAVPEPQVTRTLEEMASRSSIARLGRGLWVLRRYRTVAEGAPDFRGAAWFSREFRKTFHVPVGRRDGAIQFGSNEELPVHRWWPYVQGFSAQFVEESCRRYGVGPGSVVLDPFCGSGTVPVVARTLGARSLGVDLMPITAFVAAAKSEWDVEPARLREAVDRVLRDRGPSRLAAPFLKETPRHFAPGVLRSLLRLKENIWATPPGPVQQLLKLAFASILIESSHLKRSPCLGYKPKSPRSAELPYRLFRAAGERIEQDLAALQRTPERWGPPQEIVLGNSGSVPWREGSVDLAITSPPYVNGMDYVTNYKVDLAWMDMVSSYEGLRALRASLVACDNIPKATALEGADGTAPVADPWVEEVCASVQANIRRKKAYRRNDMASIVRKYFADLLPVIANVHRALKPGGRFLVVNGDSLIAGTYIPGDMIFARLAHQVGFEVEAFDVARSRRSGQRRGFELRESITTLRKSARRIGAAA